MPQANVSVRIAMIAQQEKAVEDLKRQYGVVDRAKL